MTRRTSTIGKPVAGVTGSTISKVRRRLWLPAGQQGQSLVELVITLPILLLLLLGMAELGAVFYSYQIVVNAAREGARYGAKSLHIPDENIAAWTRQSAGRLPITVDLGGTPKLVGEKATILVTRVRKVYSEGAHTYEVIETYREGEDQPTILTEEWYATQAAKSADLDWPSGVPNQAVDLIAVEMMYDHPQLTGFFDVGDITPNPVPLHSLTVMRVGGSRIPSCDCYPVGVREGVLEVLDPGTTWTGDIFEGGGSGDFGWMCWSKGKVGDAEYLAQMLADPSTSRRDFDNATNPDDHWLNTGDDVYANTGISNCSAMRDALAELVGQRIRLPVWEYFYDGSGLDDPDYYHISGFVWMEIVDYDLPPGHGGTITAIFRGWDETCTSADLTVTKQANPDPLQVGEPLTYTLHVTNTGNVDLTATITDVLPGQVSPGGIRTWLADIPTPGGVWMERVVVTVETGYSGVLTNVVQVTTDEGATGVYTETSIATGDYYVYLPLVLREFEGLVLKNH